MGETTSQSSGVVEEIRDLRVSFAVLAFVLVALAHEGRHAITKRREQQMNLRNPSPREEVMLEEAMQRAVAKGWIADTGEKDAKGKTIYVILRDTFEED